MRSRAAPSLRPLIGITLISSMALPPGLMLLARIAFGGSLSPNTPKASCPSFVGARAHRVRPICGSGHRTSMVGTLETPPSFREKLRSIRLRPYTSCFALLVPW